MKDETRIANLRKSQELESADLQKRQASQLSESIASISSEIQAARERIESKRGEIAVVDRAPVPREVARQRLVEYLDRQAATIDFDYRAGCFFRPENFRPDYLLAGVVASGDGGEGRDVLLDGALAFLFKDQLLAKFDECFPVENPESMTLQDRADALKRLKAEILELEIAEEALILEMADAGLVFERRPDASPEAVLGWFG